jgi:hypothetical protein
MKLILRIQYYGANNPGPNIYYNTDKVEIGNNSPQYEFDVTGDINFTGNLLKMEFYFKDILVILVISVILEFKNQLEIQDILVLQDLLVVVLIFGIMKH